MQIECNSLPQSLYLSSSQFHIRRYPDKTCWQRSPSGSTIIHQIIAIHASTTIGSPLPPPIPLHQPLIIQGLRLPYLLYSLNEKLDCGAELLPLEFLLLLLILVLVLLCNLIGGKWGRGRVLILPPLLHDTSNDCDSPRATNTLYLPVMVPVDEDKNNNDTIRTRR